MEISTPVLWAEDPVPDNFKECTKCELHSQKSKIIWGEGNPNAKMIVILDNPGCREDKDGHPFVCATRQTLQMAAFAAGLSLDDLYVSYILKCRPVRRYNKDIARNICLSHLLYQIETYNFKVAFCLGDIAVKAFFENSETSVKLIRGKLHLVRGLKTLASYHPLAVRRRPNLYNNFIKDWELAAKEI